jgi:hypothetical protein
MGYNVANRFSVLYFPFFNETSDENLILNKAGAIFHNCPQWGFLDWQRRHHWIQLPWLPIDLNTYRRSISDH